MTRMEAAMHVDSMPFHVTPRAREAVIRWWTVERSRKCKGCGRRGTSDRGPMAESEYCVSCDRTRKK
jgi:hypothetical protein